MTTGEGITVSSTAAAATDVAIRRSTGVVAMATSATMKPQRRRHSGVSGCCTLRLLLLVLLAILSTSSHRRSAGVVVDAAFTSGEAMTTTATTATHIGKVTAPSPNFVATASSTTTTSSSPLLIMTEVAEALQKQQHQQQQEEDERTTTSTFTSWLKNNDIDNSIDVDIDNDEEDDEVTATTTHAILNSPFDFYRFYSTRSTGSSTSDGSTDFERSIEQSCSELALFSAPPPPMRTIPPELQITKVPVVELVDDSKEEDEELTPVMSEEDHKEAERQIRKQYSHRQQPLDGWYNNNYIQLRNGIPFAIEAAFRSNNRFRRRITVEIVHSHRVMVRSTPPPPTSNHHYYHNSGRTTTTATASSDPTTALRAVFCGYHWTMEEYRRLKSANVMFDNSRFGNNGYRVA